MKIVGILWGVGCIVGTVTLMTWLTYNAPICLPVAFAACMFAAFGGASLIGRIGGKR